jgi:cytochrome c
MRSLKTLIALVAAVAVAGATVAYAQSKKPGPGAKHGKPIAESDIATWDIDIRTPDGKGLPAGKGSVAEGKEIYAAKCLPCHGPDGKAGDQVGALFGGVGSFKTNARVLTPGSMYPYAAILFDYTRRAMPMTAPQSLSDNDVYALSAYILFLNGLVKEDAVMDAKSLAAVQMPNRDGFIPDDRPDTKATRCMKDCM